MKVLISFVSKNKYKNFEGERLRKCLKGALELSGVPYTDNIGDNFDIMHLISMDEENKIIFNNEDNKPVVISCLYSESDPGASYLEYKNKDGVRTYNLSIRAIRFLSKGDLILVPSNEAKNFLIDKGINKNIEVISSGVNISRFDFSNNEEKQIFYRYFREDEKKKLIIALGDYDTAEGITSFIDIAIQNPNSLFYYFGPTLIKYTGPKIKRLVKKAPKNAKFVGAVPDDVYKSALLNASIFLLPSYKPIGTISILEAMAAKCQIIAREEAISFSSCLKEGETAYVAKFSETLSCLVKDYLEEKICSTVLQAYQEANKYRLENIGKQLKQYYIKTCKVNE